MRRISFLLAVGLVAAACSAQSLHWTDSASVAWDAVTADEDGVPLAPDDVVAYEVFAYDSAQTIDDQVVGNLVSKGAVAVPRATVVLSGSKRAVYWIGVRAVVTTASGAVERSAIAWSYDNAATDGNPFGLIPGGGVIKVPKPKKIRIGE